MAKPKKEFKSRLKKIAKHVEKLDELSEEVFILEVNVHRSQDETMKIAQALDRLTGLLEAPDVSVPEPRRDARPVTV